MNPSVGPKDGNQQVAGGEVVAAVVPPAWGKGLDDHPERARLEFETMADMERAIRSLGHGITRRMPVDIPDGRVLEVPAEAVEHFRALGVPFTIQSRRLK